MATTIINFANTTVVKVNGAEVNNLYLNGTKRWGRYYIQEAYQVWVSSGYTQTTTNDSGWKFEYSPKYYVYAEAGGVSYKWYWAGSSVATTANASVSVGGYTYYRGDVGDTDNESYWRYSIRRTWVSSSWVDTSHYETRYRNVYAYYY